MSTEMKLHIPESIYINKNIRPKDDAQEVVVEEIDGMLWISYNDGAINLALTLEEMRGIMRLFDVPEED